MPDTTGQIFMDFRPASKRHQDTSKLAETRITESGERLKHAEMVLIALRLHNGSTSAELAEYLVNLDRYQIARRLPELQYNGLIRKGKPRICGMCNNVCDVWFVI